MDWLQGPADYAGVTVVMAKGRSFLLTEQPLEEVTQPQEDVPADGT